MKKVHNHEIHIIQYHFWIFKQNITFIRTDKDGNVQHCFRKSTCIPYRIGPFIIANKWRSGHEGGLMQYNISKPIYSYRKNKEGWKKWKEKEWKTIEF